MPSVPGPRANLLRGQNIPLDEVRVVATVSSAVPVDVSALLVTPDLRVRSDADLVFYNAPVMAGVRWSDSGGEQRIEVDLARIPPDVHAVLVAVSLSGMGTFGTVPPPLLRVDSDTGRPLVGFGVAGLGPERAIVGLELYRRGEGWKVRAVGQGYAGGLAELVTAHGVEVDDPGEAMPAAPRSEPAFGAPGTAGTTPMPNPGGASGRTTDPGTPGSGAPAAGGSPSPGPAPAPAPAPGSGPGPGSASAHEVDYVERAWLVWEDASRSLAAFRASTDHALGIRSEEISGRATPGRYEQLSAAAAARLDADMRQLREELTSTEGQAGPELAPFSAATWLAWQPRTDLADGVLVGHLTTEDTQGPRVPLILRVPWRRPVWVSSGTMPGDAAAFAWSLVTRFLAAFPPGTVGIEVLDAYGSSGAGWANSFDAAAVHHVLGGGVATGHAAGERLRRLLDLVDLRRIGVDDADPGSPLAVGPPVRLVVVFDAATALADSDDADRLLRLVEDGPLAGMPVILVGTGELAAESARTLRVRQACHNLPSGEDMIHDPWVGTGWIITPDVLPDVGDGSRPPALFTHVAVAHARAAAGA